MTFHDASQIPRNLKNPRNPASKFAGRPEVASEVHAILRGDAFVAWIHQARAVLQWSPVVSHEETWPGHFWPWATSKSFQLIEVIFPNQFKSCSQLLDITGQGSVIIVINILNVLGKLVHTGKVYQPVSTFISIHLIYPSNVFSVPMFSPWSTYVNIVSSGYLRISASIPQGVFVLAK